MTTYHTVREIGRGGFGVVEEVETNKGQKFATKTLAYPGNASNADKADLRARFEREVKYQGAIDHRHVVPIIGKNLKDDPPWFVMPLAEGSLQKELLRRSNPRRQSEEGDFRPFSGARGGSSARI